MSFARIVGLQPRILAAATRHTHINAVITRRLSSTSCSHAEHRPELQSNLEERIAHRNHQPPAVEYDAQGLEVNPYRNGPSAIDKAVHLFFFTEILRGIPFVLVESLYFTNWT